MITKEEIELAIKNKDILFDKWGTFCIANRISDDSIYGIWYFDIDLQNFSCRGLEQVAPNNCVIKIIKSTEIDKLWFKLGYD